MQRTAQWTPSAVLRMAYALLIGRRDQSASGPGGAGMPTDPTVLEEEVAFYNARKAEWLRLYEGRFALIKGRELVGTFATLEEAYEHGLSRFGNVPMLIRQIL